MGKLLAALDFSPSSTAALKAILPLQEILREGIVLYHAYQLPRGLPFLSSHIIEKMEREAESATQKEIRAFVQEHVPTQKRRSIRIVAQRDFPIEGLERYLKVGRHTLLAIGAQGKEKEEGTLGFHTRHFIQHSRIPTLITFPETKVSWKRILIAYDFEYRSAKGMKFLRRLIQRGNIEVSGLIILRPNPQLDKLHQRLQKQIRASSYTRVVWSGVHLIHLLMQAAHSYQADVIALHTSPKEIIEGMRELSVSELSEQPAWLFLPSSAAESAEESIEE
ncbi:MAG: universal stress protein [Bacteroidia bacterium]|nr:universal stress protein [Bacteroidia bacterium]